MLLENIYFGLFCGLLYTSIIFSNMGSWLAKGNGDEEVVKNKYVCSRCQGKPVFNRRARMIDLRDARIIYEGVNPFNPTERVNPEGQALRPGRGDRLTPEDDFIRSRSISSPLMKEYDV